MTVMTYAHALVIDDGGQDLLEYALLVGLIVLVAIVAVTTSGGSIAAAFQRIPAEMDAAGLTTPAP